MAIHMEIQIAGADFRVTLSRDDAGNYVAEAARASRSAPPGAEPPRVRVVDRVKERALHSLFDSLSRLTEARPGPEAPAAA